MAAICEKDFALHVGPAVGLVAYWTFDGGPPYPSELNSPDLDLATLIGTPTLGVGILNADMSISPQVILDGEGVTTNQTGNPLIKIANGFAFTTWVAWSDLGGPATSTNILEIYFLNSSGAEVLNFKVTIPGTALGIGPQFFVIEKNNASFFTPAPAFGTGPWNFIHVQFDFASKKIGFQRGLLPFGLSSLEESAAIADDLSTIAKGYIVLRSVRGAGTITSSYGQDESGFWTRLLTPDEIDDLWGAGTPPAYPAIPQ